MAKKTAGQSDQLDEQAECQQVEQQEVELQSESMPVEPEKQPEVVPGKTTDGEQAEFESDSQPREQEESEFQPLSEEDALAAFDLSAWMHQLDVEVHQQNDSRRGDHSVVYSRKLGKKLGTLYLLNPSTIGVAVPGGEKLNETHTRFVWSRSSTLETAGNQLFSSPDQAIQALAGYVAKTYAPARGKDELHLVVD